MANIWNERRKQLKQTRPWRCNQPRTMTVKEIVAFLRRHNWNKARIARKIAWLRKDSKENHGDMQKFALVLKDA